MKGFVLRLVPPRPDFATTMSDDERSMMHAHGAYWGELLAQGKVAAFGPVADPAGGYGLGVVLAEDMAEAEAIRDGDPTMASGSGFRTEIAAMYALITPAGRFDGPA